MPTNWGSQAVHIKFFDPVTNPNVNFMALDIRKIGIYSGGRLVRSSDTVAYLTPLSCEISDSAGSGNQVRVTTSANVNINISSAAPFVVLRWTYTSSTADDYLNIGGGSVGPTWTPTACAAPLTNDVIVGKGVYSGSTLSGVFDYSLRTKPDVFDLFLKVIPTDPISMSVRLLSGRINYGDKNLPIIDQLSPALTPPGSNSHIGLLQITTLGAIKNPITYGASAATPIAPTYGGLFTAAEITVPAGATAITSAMIRDVRSYVSNGTQLNVLLPSQAGYSGYFLGSDGTNVSWQQVLPPIAGNNGKFLRVNTAGTGVEWSYVTYAP